jgi:hypothetical protein
MLVCNIFLFKNENENGHRCLTFGTELLNNISTHSCKENGQSCPKARLCEPVSIMQKKKNDMFLFCCACKGAAHVNKRFKALVSAMACCSSVLWHALV